LFRVHGFAALSVFAKHLRRQRDKVQVGSLGFLCESHFSGGFATMGNERTEKKKRAKANKRAAAGLLPIQPREVYHSTGHKRTNHDGFTH
jgi:hypothetical protein